MVALMCLEAVKGAKFKGLFPGNETWQFHGVGIDSPFGYGVAATGR